ncbi:helix-turn-helix domain-containing protein [Stenotrophomonas sp. AB1(2024)]|uniref:helix-turn-helix domain-containing protein n=1 Tax=Stenotrophomonas sp. AB1(2024) TaxID=3132215 RepID=UPI00309F0CF7
MLPSFGWRRLQFIPDLQYLGHWCCRPCRAPARIAGANLIGRGAVGPSERRHSHLWPAVGNVAAIAQQLIGGCSPNGRPLRIAGQSNGRVCGLDPLGAHHAGCSRWKGITQVQLAETLGVSQQTITAYEVGRRRIQVSALPVIAQALGVTVEALVAETPKPAKRGPAPKLQQQLERISQLPKARQRFVMEMRDTVLQQQGG